MEFLLIDPKKIAKTTILGGNVDVDKYRFCIYDTQKTVLEPLLGTELYDKILADAEANTLVGLYLELKEKFIDSIVKNETVAKYLEIANYTVANGGIFKHRPDSKEVVDKEEAQFLANKSHALAQLDIIRFNKWIFKNDIPEYKVHQEEVNAVKNIKTTYGWHL